MNPLLSRLASLRRRVLIIEGWRGTTALLSLVVGAVLFAGLIDWTVQLPSLVRALLLVGIVTGGGYVAYRYLIAPLACPVDNLSLALRVEEANPELNDSLASTVQFLTVPLDTPGAVSSSPAMRDKAVQQAVARSSQVDFGGILSYRGALLFGASFFVIAAVAAHFIYHYPDRSGIALVRLGDPFGGHTWTTVDVPEAPTVVARGQPLSINATLVGLIPGTAKVEVLEDTSKGDEPVRPDEKNYAITPEQRQKGEHNIRHFFDMTKYTKNFKFRVVANDGSYPKNGRWHAVSVVAPPKHVDLDGQPSPQVDVTPPSYTGLDPQKLTPGTKMIKAWAGSQVVFRAATDRKVAPGKVWFEYRPRDVYAKPPVPAFRAVALMGALGSGNPRPGLTEMFLGQTVWDRIPAEVDSTGVMYTVKFVPWVPGTCVVHLEDDIGLANTYNYELDVEIDPLPYVRMVQPATDLTLLPDAEPTLKFQADDETFALRSVFIEFERRGIDDKGGPVERQRALLKTAPGYEQNLPQIRAPLAIAQDSAVEPIKTKPKRVEIISTWRLANQFKIGDVLYIEACADDYCDVYGSRRPARSHQVKIQIVGKGELAKVIGEKLEGVQKNVEEIEKMQKAAHDIVKEVEKNPKAAEKDIEKIVEAEAATKQILEKVGNPDEGLRNDLAKLQQLLRDNKMQDTEAKQQADMIKGALDLLAQQEEQIESLLNQARKKLASEAGKDPKDKKEGKDDPKKADPLTKAEKVQDNALKNLAELQQAMQPWASMEKAKSEVRSVLEQQQQLKKELDGLKAKKEEMEAAGADAKPEEKRQLQDEFDKKAGQLNDLAQRAEKLQGMINDMQKNRENKGDKVNADRLKEAGKIAAGAEIPQKMRDVAKDLKNNNQNLQQDQQKQQKNIDNLEKMLAALDGKDDAALEALKQKHDKAKEQVEQLAKKLKDLEKKLEEANNLKDQEERLKKKEQLAKEFGAVKEDADKLARELARLQETRAAKDIEKLGADAEKAGEKLAGGGDPGEEQKAIQEDLKNVKKDMKQFEEELAREQLAKIADRLQGFLEREETAIERSKDFNKRLLAKKSWTPSLAKSIEGDASAQEGLAKEVESLKEKIKEAKVFEHILSRSARLMKDAAEVMKDRKDNGMQVRQFDLKAGQKMDEDDIEAENESSKTTINHQTQAAGGLKRLIDSIKQELAKKPPEPKQDDAAQGGAEDQQPQGGFKAQDGIPPMAQLKALQAEQKDLKSRTEEFSKRNPDTMKLNAQQRSELERIQQDQRSLQDLFRQITAGAEKKGDAP